MHHVKCIWRLLSVNNHFKESNMDNYFIFQLASPFEYLCGVLYSCKEINWGPFVGALSLVLAATYVSTSWNILMMLQADRKKEAEALPLELLVGEATLFPLKVKTILRGWLSNIYFQASGGNGSCLARNYKFTCSKVEYYVSNFVNSVFSESADSFQSIEFVVQILMLQLLYCSKKKTREGKIE